ncbi:MAG: hypothetical protein Phog2KO_32170 [Phototrophicaceae bacterium]
MNKQKRKNEEDASCSQQVVGCSNIFIRLLAGSLMLVFIGLIAFLFYIKSESPEIDIGVFAVITSLFAYLCGYVAFNQSKEKFPHKPKSIAQGVINLLLFIAWISSMFVMIISAFSIFLAIGILLAYPSLSTFGMLIAVITLTLVFAFICRKLRPPRNSTKIQNLMDVNKYKNDWQDDELD